MSSIGVSSMVFACLFAGGVVGMLLRVALPKNHLSDDSKDAVKLGMALISTMSALVLGLLVSSAKNSYDAQGTELTATSANIVLLDRVLGHYGPETKETREQLRNAVEGALNEMWGKKSAGPKRLDAPLHSSEVVFEKIRALEPKDENQHSLKAQAMGVLEAIGQTRWLQYEQASNTVPLPLLMILVSWLTMLFVGLGLFAPPNATVITSLVISQLAVSGAIFLILEFYSPFGGLIEISSAPLRAALVQLGK